MQSKLFYLKEAEKSLLYFRSIKKYSSQAKQQIDKDLQKLHFNSSDDDDGGFSMEDFSELTFETAIKIFNKILW